MGILDIPSYDKKDGIIAAILAIVLGGLGVLIVGIWKGQRDVTILGAILLVLYFAVGIGHLLGIIWGVIVLVKSL